MTKLIVYAVMLLALIGGIAWGGMQVRAAFAQRTALRAQVAMLKQHLTTERDRTRAAVAQATSVANALAGEIHLREALVNKANLRYAQIRSDLSHAQDALTQWRAQASPALAHCLDLRVPAGVVGLRDHAADSAAGATNAHHHQAAAAAGAVPARGAHAAADGSPHHQPAARPAAVPGRTAHRQLAVASAARLGRRSLAGARP